MRKMSQTDRTKYMTLKKCAKARFKSNTKANLKNAGHKEERRVLFLQEILIRTVVWYLIHPLADDHQCWDIASRLTNAVLMVFTGS